MEEVGEVAEVLNGRSGRKEGVQGFERGTSKRTGWYHSLHHVAIAAINHIDLTKTIFEKDKTAAIKYQHERDLEGFLKEFESWHTFSNLRKSLERDKIKDKDFYNSLYRMSGFLYEERIEVSTKLVISLLLIKSKESASLSKRSRFTTKLWKFSLILEKLPPTIGYLTIDFPNTGGSPIHDKLEKSG